MEKQEKVLLTDQMLTNELNDVVKSNIEILFKKYLSPQPNGKEFLTRKETAQFFSISLVALHDWCKRGIIKPYKAGNRTYFRHSELVDLLLNSNKAA